MPLWFPTAATFLFIKLFFLCLGNNQVHDDAQDQGASDSGQGNLADSHSHAADAGDQNGSNHEQVLVLVQVNLNASKNLFVVASILIPGIGGLSVTFGKVTLTTIACALILGILTNTILAKGKED